MKKKIKLDFLSKDEKKYLSLLNLSEQKNIIKSIYKLNNLNKSLIPFRFKIIKLDTTNDNKAYLLKLYDIFCNLDTSSSEYFKYKIFFDTIISIPFNKFSNINIKKLSINDYLIQSKEYINKFIYGHEQTKNIIIQTIAQYITNPSSIGNIIGLHGNPGIGKTSFIKCISHILQRPLEIINLSGSQDISFLEGHSFTYEGAKYGKIIHSLIKHKCMNPIIFFDEVDKISKTSKGEELENLLINITDTTQNFNFNDKYLQEINIDLSKTLFFFSYNNINNINYILLDRIFNINLSDFNTDDKITIAHKFIIPNLLKNYSFKNNHLTFNINSIKYIIENFCYNDYGVRNFKQIINNIISKIHTIYITNNHNIINIDKKITFPFQLNKNNIKYFL